MDKHVFLVQPKVAKLPTAEGYFNLADVDIDSTVYRVADYWESWPEALYTPESFESGDVFSLPQFLPRSAYKSIPYATHRMHISLPAGGTPGTTREGTEHRVLERTGVALEIALEENLPLVFGSTEELTQVLFNLSQNAKNHTEVGKITVEMRQTKGGIVATVADTGTGILPELLPRVLEKV